MRSASRVFGFGIIGPLVFALSSACGNQNTYRDDAAKQAAVESKLRDQELEPVLGTYCGKMRLTQSGLDFDVVLILARSEINSHSTQSSDPTLNVRVPRLAGSMRFPAITQLGNAAFQSLPELIHATGGTDSISITEGDYTPADRQLYLPFMVPGHSQGNYGELRGAFGDQKVTGTWFSISFQTVGAFDVKRCEGASS